MSQPTTSRRSRRRLSAGSVTVGVLGSLALVASTGATLSGLTATITNSTNSAASATIAVEETSGALTCRSYDSTTTCATINKYGGTATPMLPGGSQTTTVTFTNVGTAAVASANLTPGTCVAESTGAVGAVTPGTPNTSPSNLCSVLALKIYQAATATGTPVYDGTLSGFSSAISLGALATGAAKDYTFVVTLPTAATTAVQGQRVSQPLTWNFSQ